MKSDLAAPLALVGTLLLTGVIIGLGFFVADSQSRRIIEARHEESAWDHTAGGVAPLHTQAPPGLERGKELYGLVCVACHGLNAEGNRALNSPALHQQEDWYLAAQIQKFREGLRGRHPDDVTGKQMSPMVGGLPDPAAYDDLAAYITTLDAPVPAPEVTGDIQVGQDLYEIGCMPCHGVNGRGRWEFEAPALAGQSDWYVEAQLEKFRKGIRGSHPDDHTGTLMRGMSASLSARGARNVTAYIATLPGDASAEPDVSTEPPESLVSADSPVLLDSSNVPDIATSPVSEALQIFETRCVTCHGATGKGDGPAGASLPDKPRNYQDVAWQAAVSDEELATIIVQGGLAVGKSPFMVASPDLADKPEVVAEIINIIRGFRQ